MFEAGSEPACIAQRRWRRTNTLDSSIKTGNLGDNEGGLFQECQNHMYWGWALLPTYCKGIALDDIFLSGVIKTKWTETASCFLANLKTYFQWSAEGYPWDPSSPFSEIPSNRSHLWSNAHIPASAATIRGHARRNAIGKGERRAIVLNSWINR